MRLRREVPHVVAIVEDDEAATLVQPSVYAADGGTRGSPPSPSSRGKR